MPQGTGNERRLHIGLPTALGGPKSGTISREARRLWVIAQNQGGAMWQLSLGEIQAMLDANAVTPHLAQLDHQR